MSEDLDKFGSMSEKDKAMMKVGGGEDPKSGIDDRVAAHQQSLCELGQVMKDAGAFTTDGTSLDFKNLPDRGGTGNNAAEVATPHDETAKQSSEISEKDRNCIQYDTEEIDYCLRDILRPNGISAFSEQGVNNIKTIQARLKDLREILTPEEDEYAAEIDSAIEDVLKSEGKDTSSTGGRSPREDLDFATSYFKDLMELVRKRTGIK